ncbi:MAG: glutamate synthase large chain, partial [Actinomycetota bacterium]|nr:glutamate synthase large chain [Actinomycetota bacterium]
LGFRTLDEAIGHAEVIDVRKAVDHWKAAGLDLSPILFVPETDSARRCVVQQNHGLDRALDNQLIELAADALERGEPVRAQVAIRNVNRTVGTMLGAEVTRRFGGDGLPDGTIDLTFTGSAGQSFGAFVPAGISLRLEGDANDYLGKGLSGGRLVVRPDRAAQFRAEEHIIAGNVIGYGATSGEIYLRGIVGERCCVRNSGATVVVEGAGDHLCEYMTGGRVVVLGATGRNVAAGMSGGIAYLLDLDAGRVNRDMVDIEPLADADAEFLRTAISRHLEETGSAVAEGLLADWSASLARFSKIMPRDYRRVLMAQARAEAEGRDVNEAIMEASRG